MTNDLRTGAGNSTTAEIASSASRGLSDAASDAIKTANDTIQTAKQKASDVTDQVAETAGQVQAAASDLARSASDHAKTFASELERMGRANPLGTIAGAVLVGVVIGLIGRGRS